MLDFSFITAMKSASHHCVDCFHELFLEEIALLTSPIGFFHKETFVFFNYEKYLFFRSWRVFLTQ